jgi:UDP-N-acetylbacillosamine N-acetyltransferase
MAANFTVAGFIDDSLPTGSQALGFHILGALEAIEAAVLSDAEIAIGIGSISRRKTAFLRLKAYGLRVATVVHPRAMVSPSATIGEGSYVGPMALIHTQARIACACLINSGAIVDHDCQVGNFCEISVGALLGGGVSIGAETFVGMGAAVRDHLHIGDVCIIGAGTVVVKDLPDGILAIGVPARVVRTLFEKENQP